MIIGGSKKKVIENIKQAILEQDYNRKVEEGDPELSSEEEAAVIKRFFELREKKTFPLKQRAARETSNLQLKKMSGQIEIVGLEKLDRIWSDAKKRGLSGKNAGFIITSNHFNPLDNVIIRKLVKEKYADDLRIVIQASNLAMSGWIGDLMNYLDNIPIAKSPQYIKGQFMDQLKRELVAGHPVLIYPEEEMWFNYRKPRPSKRGAFYFASELKVPVLPCFVEIIDLDKKDNDEFFEVRYILHILEPIFPDLNLSVRQNSIEMARKDYAEKCQAYEEAYRRPLNYKFDEFDIAGWQKEI